MRTVKSRKRKNYKFESNGNSDGVKFYFEDGAFVICRFSGTEPLLRIFAEDKTEELAKQLIQAVKSAIY